MLVPEVFDKGLEPRSLRRSLYKLGVKFPVCWSIDVGAGRRAVRTTLVGVIEPVMASVILHADSFFFCLGNLLEALFCEHLGGKLNHVRGGRLSDAQVHERSNDSCVEHVAGVYESR